jgi:hypothetical protein
MFQQFCGVVAKNFILFRLGFALGKKAKRTELFSFTRHYFDFAWNAGTELRKCMI